jgi:hypothetical protein
MRRGIAVDQACKAGSEPAALWAGSDYMYMDLLAVRLYSWKKFTFHDSESQHSLFMTLRANIHFS